MLKDTSFWALPPDELLRELRTTPEGIHTAEAERRQAACASVRLKPQRNSQPLRLLLVQFRSPIILILLFASGVSFFLAERSDALIILGIILTSALLSFWQEYSAARAVAGLLALVQITARAWRDGVLRDVPADSIVPGDVVALSAGSSLPGDALVLDAKDLFVDEATLTGETYPVEKSAATLAVDVPLRNRTNSLFLGTHVVSGQARAVIVAVGKETEFGRIAHRMRLRAPETEFERGVRRFGYLLLEVTLLLVFAIFAINVYLERPVLESFLFSMALAVGLTPQLLPAIISVNLSHGAKRMAERKVVVKRLAAIENFGSMNVLCSDKTGTLTEGSMRLHAALNLDGRPSEKVLLLAHLNAMFETGFPNPLDEALRRHRSFDLTGYRKLEEEPYDFVRKRLSILAATPRTHLLITKGAVESMLSICLNAERADGTLVPIDQVREAIREEVRTLSGEGFRTLGLACRDMGASDHLSKEDEAEMTLLGLLVFADPPKMGIADTIATLRALGVSLKMVTGDQGLVAAHVGREVGLANPRLLTGSDLRGMSDDALRARANEVDIFAEIEPNQKERIILALRASGNVVGYLGDGINDAPALHAADVGISVDRAVDVAKEAADLVLLEQDLGVLVQGVREGRRDLREHAEICIHGDQREFRQYVQHGRRVAVFALPAVTAEANPIDERIDGHSRNDDCHRPCRSRTDRSAPPLGHPLYSALHVDLRVCKLPVRLPHIRHVAAGAAFDDRPVPYRLVCRVRCLGVRDRTGDSHAPTLRNQPPIRSLVADNPVDRTGDHVTAGDSGRRVLGV